METQDNIDVKEKKISHHKRLKLKERVQIGMRKVTDKKDPNMIWILIACAAIFFVLMMVSSTWHGSVEEVSASDYPNQSAQLTFTGDTCMGRYIETQAEQEGYNAIFDGVKSVWANSDYVFTNLEYALLVKDKSKYKEADDVTISLSASVDSIDALLDAGVNVFSYANNHVGDFRSKAYLDTIKWMYEQQLNFSGYFLPVTDIEKYQDDEILLDMYNMFNDMPYTTLECSNGLSIGFLAAMSPSTSAHIQSRYILKESTENLNAYVNDSARNTDLTVVYIHAGLENTLTTIEDQEEWAHQLIDAGADIVIGAHPHVLQPIELYDDGIIFYSLGNFIFDQGETYQRDSVIVQYNFEQSGTGYFELIPVRINDGHPQVTADQYYIDRINQEMTKRLNNADYYINEDGHVIIPWTKQSLLGFGNVTGGGISIK